MRNRFSGGPGGGVCGMGGDAAADPLLGEVMRGGVAEWLADGVTVGECGSSLPLSLSPFVVVDPLLSLGDPLGVSDLVFEPDLDMDMVSDPAMPADLDLDLNVDLDLDLNLDLEEDREAVRALLLVQVCASGSGLVLCLGVGEVVVFDLMVPCRFCFCLPRWRPRPRRV